MKYYFYAKDTADKRSFLMEVVINSKSKSGEFALRSTNCTERDITDFVNYFFTTISSIIVHPV